MYLISSEDYKIVKQFWASKKEHSTREIIAYNILRGKPICNGFTKRGKNIQGNDPWFALNIWVDHLRWTLKNHEAQRQVFKETFGIDVPDGFMDKLVNKR